MSYGNIYGEPERKMVIEPDWIGWRGIITRHPDLHHGFSYWAFTREGLIKRLKRVDRRQQKRIEREKQRLRRENQRFSNREIISLGDK